MREDAEVVADLERLLAGRTHRRALIASRDMDGDNWEGKRKPMDEVLCYRERTVFLPQANTLHTPQPATFGNHSVQQHVLLRIKGEWVNHRVPLYSDTRVGASCGGIHELGSL